MPLKSFDCSKCGAKCPSQYLRHGKFKERIEWLRKHYAKKHKGQFGKE